MNDAWKFNSAGQIVFGNGAIRHLPAPIYSLGSKRVAVITDPDIEKAGLLRKIEEVLHLGDFNSQVCAQTIEAYYGKDYRYVEAGGDPIYQGSNLMADLLAERAIALIDEIVDNSLTIERLNPRAPVRNDLVRPLHEAL